MKVSLHTIKQFIDFELPPVGELVARINAQLGGVEDVIDLADKYKDAKIVKVVSCEKHPNADKLSVCMVDAGSGELVQIVCGANNVHADMWAVWLPPDSTVPATYDDAEPFVLGSRELRGVISNGMLASARELAIGDDHDGIVDITEADVPGGKTLTPGGSFAEVFGLNDTIIDIENKMFTHRPDLFGQLGVAREIAGIFGKQFMSPDWYVGAPRVTEIAEGLTLEVFNDAPEKAPRFMAVVIKDVEIRQSPLWLKCALIAMGGKPINTIVDATNYVMLLTAQPTHAYDYDKLRGQTVGVRMARDGESIPLLNGKTYHLTSDDIVIADGEGAIGLAGIMGGANSEVSAETRNIVLEVANFDMYTVRKSSMRHGVFTDALTRFNKGQSPLQNDTVLNFLVATIGTVSPGERATAVFDLGDFDDCIDADFIHKVNRHEITNTFINDRLGLRLSNEQIVQLLENVEFKIEVDEKGLDIYEPFWRTDIDEPEDIVEEVGRLHGFDALPRELPQRSAKPVSMLPERLLARRVRQILAQAGANEILTYSFVHERIISSAGQSSSDAYQLSNALSPDLQYYRLSITPSLLDKVHPNIKAGYTEFSLFEIGKTHSKLAGFDDAGLPVESMVVASVYASKTAKEGAAFYRAKAQLAFLASQLAIDIAYEPISNDATSPVVASFEPKRSASIVDKATGRYLGVIGEYKKSVGRNFKLPDYTAGFELSLDALLHQVNQASQQYRPLSRYPSIERDISLKVSKQLRYDELYDALQHALHESTVITTVMPLGIYQSDDAATKNVTFRLTLTSYDTTLTSEQGNAIVDEVVSRLESSIGAERV